MRRFISGIVAVGLSIQMAGPAWAIHNQPRLIQISVWPTGLRLLSAIRADVKMQYQTWYQSPVDGSVSSARDTHWGPLMQVRNDTPVRVISKEYYAASNLQRVASSGRTYERVCVDEYQIPTLLTTKCSSYTDVTGQPNDNRITGMYLDGNTGLTNSSWNDSHTFEQEARSTVNSYTYLYRNGSKTIWLGYAKSRRTSTEFSIDAIKKIIHDVTFGMLPLPGTDPFRFVPDDLKNLACSLIGGCNEEVKLLIDQFVFSPSSTTPAFIPTVKLIHDYVKVS